MLDLDYKGLPQSYVLIVVGVHGTFPVLTDKVRQGTCVCAGRDDGVMDILIFRFAQ